MTTRTYLVECYWPGVSEAQLGRVIGRALRREAVWTEVTWIESVLVPADEIVLCVFEGPSVQAVEAATRRAGLPAERVVESLRVVTRGVQGPERRRDVR
jgi:hypothetical protein